MFPRLVAAEHGRRFNADLITSGVGGLDKLLRGGLAAGSSTLLLGPAGSGKTLIGLQYLKSAVARGDRGALFAFDEELGLLLARAKVMGIDSASARVVAVFEPSGRDDVPDCSATRHDR